VEVDNHPTGIRSLTFTHPLSHDYLRWISRASGGVKEAILDYRSDYRHANMKDSGVVVFRPLKAVELLQSSSSLRSLVLHLPHPPLFEVTSERIWYVLNHYLSVLVPAACGR